MHAAQDLHSSSSSYHSEGMHKIHEVAGLVAHLGPVFSLYSATLFLMRSKVVGATADSKVKAGVS